MQRVSTKERTGHGVVVASPCANTQGEAIQSQCIVRDSMKRTINIGLVGCGVVATAYYLPALRTMPDVEITAVCDRNVERTQACQRLFGAKEAYQNYDEMIERADIEVVFILTGPGTHVDFTLKAVAHNKHVLLQKPMALTLEEANTIVEAVRKAGVKVLIEPSEHTMLNPVFQPLRALIQQGVLGRPYWFTIFDQIPEAYHPLLGGNPYGLEAFFHKESGGMLFDYPYAPNQIVSLLGSCKSVTGLAKISVPERFIVPEHYYDAFLAQAQDPNNVNYWDMVFDQPRSQHVHMGAEDNVFSLYEMANGAIGVFHVGRPFHPVLPGASAENLRIFGTEGNLIMGHGHFASIISTHKELLPEIADDGWYHMPVVGDFTKASWPKPVPGAFNYYQASSEHLLDCIREDQDPIPNVEWGRHITEMMYGAIVSSRTGQRYEMTTTLA